MALSDVVTSCVAEQPGAIGSEFRHPLPVEQRHLQPRADQFADAEGGRPDDLAEDRNELGELVVQDVAALDVADLVGDDEEELVFRQTDRPRRT